MSGLGVSLQRSVCHHDRHNISMSIWPHETQLVLKKFNLDQLYFSVYHYQRNLRGSGPVLKNFTVATEGFTTYVWFLY